MAGGTGGHVFPALAIAQRLKQEGCEVLWLGTRGRMEERLVPKYGFPIEYIQVKGIRRNGLKAKLSAPFMIVHAVRQSLAVIKSFKPDVVLGMGGYASGPGGVAAWLKHIPVVLHEQNAAAGLTNRLLFKLAKRVMLGFPGAFTGSKVEVVGNPVREDLLSLYKKGKDFKREKLHILIVGGSLGARALNTNLPKALSLFTGGICVMHQCGQGNSEAVRKLYGDVPFDLEVSDFIDDMKSAYENADLIVCRAGALTVAEVSATGTPAIFVPLPTAVDDHQTKNAGFLEKKGAALLIPEKDLVPEDLYAKILELSEHRERLSVMSDMAYDCAIVDATDRAVAVLDSVVKD